MLRPAHNARRPSGDGQSNSKQTFQTKLLRREASSLFAPGMPTSPGRTTLTPNRMASRLAPRWNSPRASHISVFSGREADEALFLQDVQHLAQPHDIRGTVSTPTQRQSYSAFNGVEETLPERSPHEARQVVDELWSNRNSLPMSVEKQTFIERLSKNAVQRRDGNQRRSPRSWWTMLRNLFLAIHAFKSRNEMRNLPTGTTALVIQTHLQQWKRSKALEVEDVKACWIIDPSSWLRLFWDTSTALVLLIMVFYVPYHISFVGRSIQYQIFDIFVTIWFSVDILLSFVTAYEKDGMLVTRPKRIAMHYAKGYLLVDLVATIPFDAIIYGNGRNQGDADFGRLSKAAKVPRLLRYIRAFKLIRVYGNQNMVQRAMVYAQLNPGILRLGAST